MTDSVPAEDAGMWLHATKGAEGAPGRCYVPGPVPGACLGFLVDRSLESGSIEGASLA